jgi:succinate-semialdehyde dehydrogenase/glutarate-semialdehyde dehydrogenase
MAWIADPGWAVVNRTALAKVASLAFSTCTAGPRVAAGGGTIGNRGYFFEPTVLVYVPRDAAILQEEIFGPLARVVRFNDTEDAIALANGTDAGLVASAYTKDLSPGLELSRRPQAWMVGINKAVVSDPAAPSAGSSNQGSAVRALSKGYSRFLEIKYTAFPYS